MSFKQELKSDIVNTPIRKRVTDLDHAGGDTGAMQAFASLRDVNVVLDGPVGCHVMPAVAVINYTDSIPYLQNVTCSELSENEVTIAGTLPALKEKVARASAQGRQVFIVSTPVSELIGAAWTTLDEGVKGTPLFFNSESLDADEWVSRDRALLFLWQNRDHFVRPEGVVAPAKPARPSVNIVGPTYGCFNSYSDLAEMKRLLAGIGADVNVVYPFEANSYDTPRLADAGATVCMYREFGASLAREVGLPVFFAPFGLEETTAFLRGLGEALGVQAQVEAFIALEKRHRVMAHLARRFVTEATPLVTSAGVVAQVWRGGGGAQVPVAFLLRHTHVVDLTGPVGRTLGRMLGVTGTKDPVDAHVALLARERGWAIVSSDPEDLHAIDPTLVIERI